MINIKKISSLYDRLTALIIMNVIIWFIIVKTLSSPLSLSSINVIYSVRHYHSYHLYCRHHYLLHRHVILSVKLMKVAHSNYPSCMRVYQCESAEWHYQSHCPVIHIWSLAYNCLHQCATLYYSYIEFQTNHAQKNNAFSQHAFRHTTPYGEHFCRLSLTSAKMQVNLN